MGTFFYLVELRYYTVYSICIVSVVQPPPPPLYADLFTLKITRGIRLFNAVAIAHQQNRIMKLLLRIS